MIVTPVGHSADKSVLALQMCQEDDSVTTIHIINLALEAVKLALITFYYTLVMNLLGNDRLQI